MIAALKSVEMLLAEGYKPERTILLGCGQDEEVGGKEGAAKIVQFLQEKDIRLAAMLDEGGTNNERYECGIIPVALVGNAGHKHKIKLLKPHRDIRPCRGKNGRIVMAGH